MKKKWWSIPLIYTVVFNRNHFVLFPYHWTYHWRQHSPQESICVCQPVWGSRPFTKTYF